MASAGADAGAGVLGVERAARASSEALRDEEWARFVARFRFVDEELLARRFGVSARAARGRVAKLVDARVLARSQVGRGPSLIYLSPIGARRLGLGRRRTPRLQHSRAHELAVVDLVLTLEEAERVAGRDGVILTERECRKHEAAQQRRYSVTVHGAGEPQRRWPDVVLARTGRDTVAAYELEFSPKPSRRLRAIVRGYRDAGHLHRAYFIVESPALGVRIARVARQEGAARIVRVASWDHAPEAVQVQIERRVTLVTDEPTAHSASAARSTASRAGVG
jgi:hypothetical protein